MSESDRAPRRDLPLLLAGAAVSAAGSALSLLAVTIHLRTLGPGWIAAAMSAELVPMVVLAPLAGNLVDRVRNRELLLGCLVMQGGAIAVAGTVGLHPGLAAVVLAGLVVVGAAASVANPTVAALLPRISGEQRATRAYGWYSALLQSGFLAGFALAGVLVEATSVRTALLADAATYGVMAVAVAGVRTQRIPDGHAGGSPSRWAGFGRLRADPVLRVAAAGLAAAITVSVVVNVAEVFWVFDDIGAGPAAYGVVTACWPAAGVAGGWLSGRLDGDRPLLAGLAAACVAMGAALLVAGSVASLVALAGGWVLGGAANSAQRVTMNALIRARTPDADRGRAFAAAGGVFQTANIAGLAAGAGVVGALGARACLLWAGAITVVAGAAVWLRGRAALRPGVARTHPTVAVEPAE